MRIGLIRHFPVQQKFPTGFSTAAELEAWQESYDLAEVTAGETELGGVEWQACLSSDLARAQTTARAAFAGAVQYTELLREARFVRFETGGLRLPTWLWRWALRLSWMTGHSSQRACRDGFRQRVREVADLIDGLDKDTLVVSHAGMMAYLSAELRRRGFAGPKLRIAKHAQVYVYEKAAPEIQAVVSA